MNTFGLKRKTIDAQFTRPNDANVYTAGDVVSNSVGAPAVLNFPVARGARGSGIIRHAVITTDVNHVTKLDGELYLFDTAPAPQADNAAAAFLDAEVLRFVGMIPFAVATWKVTNTGAAAAGNAILEVSPNLIFSTLGDDVSLYGILVARNAFQPIGPDVFKIRLHVEQDVET